MANNQELNYETIENGYDSTLSRINDISKNIVGTEEDSIGTSSDTTVKTGESFDNIWINTWIKSTGYVPKKRGFFFDGENGYVECAKLFVRGGTTVGSLNIPDETSADSFHVNTVGDMWFGSNLVDFTADIESATAYILNDGTFKFKNGSIDGGANVTFISDTLDTNSKKILKDFTFGSADYSGAFKTGDITWNTTTGAITGGSGGLFNKNGLIFAHEGIPTITLDGTTGEITSFTLTAGTITGVTITGGTIQTASGTGKRIITSSNVMEFYNASNTNIASLNGGTLGGSEFLYIDSPSAAPFYPLHIYQHGASTQGALRIDCADSGTGSRALEIFQEGDKTALFIDVNSTSSGMALEFDYAGTATQSMYLLNNSANSDGFKIDMNNTSSGGDALIISNNSQGISAYISTFLTTSTASCLEINNDSGGKGLYLHNDKSTGTGSCLEIENNGIGFGISLSNGASGSTSEALIINNNGVARVSHFNQANSSSTQVVSDFSQAATISTNFKKILSFNGNTGLTIYTSNGVSPNGNLSGSQGDICFGANGGLAYYCTGTTNWTSM